MARSSNPTPTGSAGEVMRALAAAVRARVPVLLWGNPGVTKTATVESHARAWGMHVETIVGSNREATDFLGVPLEVDGGVRYAPPAWSQRLAAAETGLLFLDELTTSAPSVMKGMLRVIQERFVGEQALRENVAIIAAANPVEVAVDGWDLPAPMASRFVHLQWVFDRERWLTGLVDGFEHLPVPSLGEILGERTTAQRQAARQDVIAFLRAHPSLIDPAPPVSTQDVSKPYPTPRSWTNLAAVLAELDPDDTGAQKLVVAGAVGQQAASDFIRFMASRDLADPRDVIADPRTVDWSAERPDRLSVLCRSIAALVDGEDPRTWLGAVRALTLCAEAGKPDVAIDAMRRVLENQPDGASLPQRSRAAFADLLRAAGRWSDGEEAA